MQTAGVGESADHRGQQRAADDRRAQESEVDSIGADERSNVTVKITGNMIELVSPTASAAIAVTGPWPLVTTRADGGGDSTLSAVPERGTQARLQQLQRGEHGLQVTMTVAALMFGIAVCL